jgi:exodeoxyribonuclease VII large subunit
MRGELPIFSVSEVSNFIKSSLEEALPVIKIVGEVSNFSHHIQSGHIYFSLKDENSLIKAVCFKQFAEQINFKIEDGMKLTLTGKISTFVKSSHYQILVSKCEKSGVGELAKIFEELKQRLTKEGLFDEIHKKQLPFLPRKIGLITAEGGAVLHDILKTLEARFPTKIVLFKAIMQGVNSAKSVIDGVRRLNERDDVDVIIIARGGGSFEDLFEFNNEALIREVFKSKIAVISAIGHETDFTLLDFVADKRAPTPTASVIFAVPSKKDLSYALSNNMALLSQIVNGILRRKFEALSIFKLRFAKIVSLFDKNKEKLVKMMHDIKNLAKESVAKREVELAKVISQISFFDLEEVLKSGFAFVTKNGGKISSIKDVKVGEVVRIHLKDGSFDAIVKPETLL